MHTPKLFYVQDVSDADAAFQTAYKQFIAFLANSPTQQAALAAYRTTNLTGIAADSLTPHLVSQLAAGIPVMLNGCELFLITEKHAPELQRRSRPSDLYQLNATKKCDLAIGCYGDYLSSF
jgi:hypothetical protein